MIMIMIMTIFSQKLENPLRKWLNI